METLHTKGTEKRNLNAVPRRIHRRTLRNRENNHTDRKIILLFRDIAKYVRECKSCQSHKASQTHPAGTLHAHTVHTPWEQVTINLIGPLPRSSLGNTYLLTMQDRFTKWLEMKPLRKTTARAVTQRITEEIIYRHWCSDIIISDNGSQLKSKELSTVLQA